MRLNLDWLAGEKQGHYIAVVKASQPLLYARVKALPWRQVPAGSLTRDAGHGRRETRTLKTAHVSGLGFPSARQAVKITRWRQDKAAATTPPPPKPSTSTASTRIQTDNHGTRRSPAATTGIAVLL